MFGLLAAIAFALAFLLHLAGTGKWFTDLVLLGGFFTGLALSKWSK